MPRRHSVHHSPSPRSRTMRIATPLPDGVPESARQKWHACEKIRNSHVLRTILADARNRHQRRPSFHDRMAERKSSKDEGPTLWQLNESSEIFKEVLNDIHGAVKVCCKDLFGKANESAVDGNSDAVEEGVGEVKIISERWRMLLMMLVFRSWKLDAGLKHV